MAKTEHVYLRGKAKWCMVNIPDQWGNYKVSLYLTPDSLEKFKELKVKNHLKKDDDGYYVVLRRPTSKMIKGKVIGMAPPIVKDKDGVEMHDALIGNGSDITVKLEYYPYTFNKVTEHAVRLHTIRIDNLIPYAPRIEDMEAYDAEKVEQVTTGDLF